MVLGFYLHLDQRGDEGKYLLEGKGDDGLDLDLLLGLVLFLEIDCEKGIRVQSCSLE